MEYLLKIILDNSYHKFLENIKSGYIFDTITPNEEEEPYIKFDSEIVRKPTHIAAFILSYSKKIMNNIIRTVGANNIYYSDTDTLYIPKECMSVLKESNDLCGYKNYYGEDVYITEAFFLDVKRYYIKLSKENENNAMFKAQFNRLQFKSKSIDMFSNYLIDEANTTLDKKVRKYYLHPEELSDIKIIQEKWNKILDSVFISEVDMRCLIPPSGRGILFENKLVPFYFDIEKEQIKHGKVTEFEKPIKNNYSLSRNGLRSALPLLLDFKDADSLLLPGFKKMEGFNYISIPRDSKIPHSFRTNYIIDSKTKEIYHIEHKYGKVELSTISEYGKFRPIKFKGLFRTAKEIVGEEEFKNLTIQKAADIETEEYERSMEKKFERVICLSKTCNLKNVEKNVFPTITKEEYKNIFYKICFI